eukprot:CAMPEP_0113707404 /NCGR_PEP_ID=MMETSP0038_2-20120614/28357_1 /TAXON_ID=2898 /ORGANISM="Cryptomonas paramecium" /LENGTH=74 /DNA_ID=CAMNT_0000632895 /DNA_START=357 /DNA_END=581 /DNA_ORIENTATION=- /assembly_acc=CAM_ASM_000170
MQQAGDYSPASEPQIATVASEAAVATADPAEAAASTAPPCPASWALGCAPTASHTTAVSSPDPDTMRDPSTATE